MKPVIFYLLFLSSSFFFLYGQKTLGYFGSFSSVNYFKFEQGIGLGFTHSRSYKDNNKWQNIIQMQYYWGSYHYHYLPQNTGRLSYREVQARNFIFRAGKEYGFLFINKRTKKLFMGPSLTLNVLGFYETGSDLLVETGVVDSNFKEFKVETGFSPLLFMEFEHIAYKNSVFIRLEGGYLFNPVNDLASYNGFPGGWIFSVSLGYRVNDY